MFDKLIQKQIGKIPAAVLKATVLEVNGDYCTVEPIDGSPKIFRVQFRSIIKDNEIGLLIIPKVGSSVLVGIINSNDNDAFVVTYSEVESYQLTIEDISLKVDKSGVYLNGDAQKLVRGDELKKELEVEKARLTSLINAITNAPIVPSDGGASFKTSIITAIAPVQKPNYGNILSDKVKTA